MTSDPFNLNRFEDAQTGVWDSAFEELRAGRKQTHWMWFVFPQLAELGRSATARHFGISGIAEARAYLAHLVLGERLDACCNMLLEHAGTSAVAIFGEVDAMKLRSCLTLFRAAAGPERQIFDQCLARYFGGQPDPLTIAALAAQQG